MHRIYAQLSVLITHRTAVSPPRTQFYLEIYKGIVMRGAAILDPDSEYSEESYLGTKAPTVVEQ